jgi:hypothetical protein
MKSVNIITAIASALTLAACASPSIDPNLPSFTKLTEPDPKNGYQYIKSFEFSQPSTENAAQKATYCVSKYISFQEITPDQRAANMWGGAVASNFRSETLGGGQVFKYSDEKGNIIAQGRKMTQMQSGMASIPIVIDFQLEVLNKDGATDLSFENLTSSLGGPQKPIGSWVGAQGVLISHEIKNLADSIYDCMK